MKAMSETHRANMLKIQAGMKAAETGLAAMMAEAKAAGDADVVSQAQAVFGAMHAVHAQAGLAAQAVFTDAAVVILGPGR